MSGRTSLPRSIRTLVRVVVPAEQREQVLGDLEEAHAGWSRRLGRVAARRRLRREGLALLAWRLRASAPATTHDSGRERAVIFRDLVQDLHFGARTLRRRPAFAATAVVVLGVGIGAPTTVFSIVDAIFFAVPEHVREPDRLVRVYRSWAPGEGGGSLSRPDYVHYGEVAGGIAGLAAWGGETTVAYATGGEATTDLDLVFASGNYFDVLGVPLRAGRGFLAEEDRSPGTDAVLVVSHEFWQRALGGRPDVVGSRMELNRIPFTVVGVAPPGFRGVSPVSEAPDAWAPLAMFGAVTRAGRMSWWERIPQNHHNWLNVVGRLADDVEFAAAQASLVAASRTLSYEGRGESEGVMVRQQLYYRPDQEASLRTLTRMLLAAVGLVFVVAMANVAVLLLAVASTRSAELGIRKAVGAGRARLVRQLLGETLVLAGAGALLGIALAYTFADLAGALLPFPFAVSFAPALPALLLATTLALLTALGAGLAPATRAARADVRTALQGVRVVPSGGRLRHFLVVGQVALSLALVAGAFLFGRSFEAARSQPLGFETEDRLLVTVDLRGHGYDEERGRAFVETALERIRARPEVRAASTLYQIPFRGDWSSDVPVEGSDVRTWRLYLNSVSDDYFRTMGIPLLRGRPLERAEAPGGLPVVISTSLADRIAPGGDALGRPLTGGPGDTAVVVGIAADAAYAEFGVTAVPQAYFPLSSVWMPRITFVVHTAGPPLDAAPAVRNLLRELDPQMVFPAIRTLQSVVDDQIATYRVSAILVGTFGVVALLLAAAGLFGVVSFLVTARTREIGVRMALGAGRMRVARSVVWLALRLSGIGVVMGLLGSLWLRRFTEGLLYGISPADPLPLLLAAATLLGVAALAAWAPARRATRVDPLLAIRAE